MSRDAATKPPSEPNVFDSVPTRTTVPLCTPARSRPPIPPPPSRPAASGRLGPRTAWASSRMRRALWRWQRATSSSRGAVSPSMENTESVTTMVGIGAAWRRRRAASAEQLRQVVHVTVAVDGEGRAGQPAPVDDAGVVQLVREHAHARAAERAQHPEVGREAGREADGGLGPLPFGERPLQLAVDGARPGHEARGA